ncbi:hypothetical protein [Alkalihalobacillus pseudalcaliphilus]|uniref:hypothetical protein n=1 Tax=Alkalihalobacillus pseudalcaliphilus TaxID=79884 RepID=UPI00064DB6DA|nr:hypothetical protein [Alkalihalobacillus pseudalcaliphilus]KMK76260.1 hypothetical protein AB990_13710 [Alkalihalobacillus pseudalcaliphilus]
MDYIYIKLPKCHVYLTQGEIMTLLQQNPDIYITAIKRGKTIQRSINLNKRAEEKKFDKKDI